MICRFTVSRFEGPLDLLLFLIRKDEVDITDIPIASITKQYLEYLEAIQRLDLDEAGNYLLMASTLMHIKSRMLLPTEDALPLEEFEDPRMDLVRRLKAYQVVKDVALDLKNLEAEAGRYMPRAYFPEFSEADLESVTAGEVSFIDFLQAFLRCVNRWEDVVHRVQAQKINLSDMISRIVKRLGDSDKITWRELLTETTNRMERILVLLALLEMSRQQQVTLRQTRPYGNLWIIPSQNYGLQRAS